MTSICCGIVSYNPNLERLEENITAISSQIEEIYVYDNGSKNIDDIIRRFQNDHCSIIDSGANSGMAVALNALANKAIEDGFEHILFLDQDSVARPDMVNKLASHVKEDIGIVCPTTIDRNEPGKTDFYSDLQSVAHAITSGSLVNLTIYKKVGGYDERLFIDWVDVDYCYNLRLHGFLIARTKEAELLHELGSKEYAMRLPMREADGKIHFRKHYRTNHTMFRAEDKARSQAIVARKYRKTPIAKEALTFIIKVTITDLILEKHRFRLFRTKLRGRKKGLQALRQK